MLNGECSISNHDPWATDKSHWVKTGPYVMIVGKAAQEIAATYPRTMDPVQRIPTSCFRVPSTGT
jgi:hypothetical protein